ncbi:similar to Saccharomyces cerevisiae YFR014C CMK1 Calmodulin-dependent protein kinase [Maudiozyma saulgeensis]|uniref:Similar to Saccharomyces cerevisiae YFR014C CMK1 Calmodulin-dependent protein kinase n=1 Tax=Maudiozyma saulgeensis TaxID=1789683 RepID=A0A1X7QZW0_9SACH|nr:similar to Saccharomyces cerevisiae YFR014C CMK1 Calmodulin-dependent protein kinase [Kazachstania saulgeensis]
MAAKTDVIDPKLPEGRLVSKFFNKISGQPDSFINRGNYDFGKTLGAGTFGLVREAMNISTGEKVAVKILLKKALKGNDVQLQMLYDELSLLQHLHHPNIVEFKDWFESRDKFYIVTQLATGGELFDRILKRGKFTELDAVKIVIQMLAAVEYMHAQNVVHRDLKPENILYVDKSESSPIVIADFGIAKRLKSKDESINKAAGSLGYVAPEVLTSNGHGKPCDIWSLGVITYTLLCGYSPFIAESVDGFLEECTEGTHPVKFHSPYWDNITDDAKKFILRALTLDPLRRPTATQLLGDPWIMDMNVSRGSTNILPNVKKGFDLRGKLLRVIDNVKLENKLRRLRNLYIAENDLDEDLQEKELKEDPLTTVADSLHDLRLDSKKELNKLTAEQCKLKSALAEESFASIVKAVTSDRKKLIDGITRPSQASKSTAQSEQSSKTQNTISEEP